MEIQQLHKDLYLFIGDAYDSNSTIVLNGNRAVLIDALASRKDAIELQSFVEEQLRATVEFILCTHYFSDHLAALKLFPDSQIVAHEHYRHTFDAELHRSAEEESNFQEPTILFSQNWTLRWGRFHLEAFSNAGHTRSTVNVDIPEADLIHVADNLVGNLVYMKYCEPAMLFAALENIQKRGRNQILSSHGGFRDAGAVAIAHSYLETLRQHARESWLKDEGNSITGISMNACYPEGIQGTPFENIFHKRNLQTIVERKLFAPGHLQEV